MRFRSVTLAGPPDLPAFYRDVLGLPLDGDAIVVGETRLSFEPDDGGAFYHFAFLVPGDRFDATLAWAQERVELLGEIFEAEAWDARAVYFHDPAGNIVELIAHRGLEENGRTGCSRSASRTWSSGTTARARSTGPATGSTRRESAVRWKASSDEVHERDARGPTGSAGLLPGRA
ncbi:MAG TPA: VOC family protein, partial [Gaiellaceae bacterium]|nr:VOC family protein [Gaiellaceae bacterium]